MLDMNMSLNNEAKSKCPYWYRNTHMCSKKAKVINRLITVLGLLFSELDVKSIIAKNKHVKAGDSMAIIIFVVIVLIYRTTKV